MTRAHFAFAILVAALVAGCGSTSSSSPSSPSPTPAPSPSPAASGAASVTIPSNARTLGSGAFVPNPITVSQGATVTWSNTDSTVHTVVADAGAFSSDQLNQRGTFSFTFGQRGTFTYHCSIHPSMTGTIVVQ